ncbi:hypothetical protein KPL70_017530 [Citrus sinensis]|uniref:Myb/SANT-like domain-containing protein n=1 Tax=Citrus clementina TaxID=85681 RepID=V4URL0_CITCL|nr:hypothetical protein CICLE_v10013481mg [Citrus x clementina]KAH9671916.1 hypothetical protein KPL70_017530 [Citrus sinensis]
MDPHDVRIRFNVGQLKSKFNRLRKKHREFSALIAHTRFGWDPVSNTVIASEAIWAEYIKVKLYSHQVLLSSDEDREFEENFLGHGVHVDIEDDDSIESLSDTRTEKGLVGQLQLQLSGKKNKSEFDNYFKMTSSMMNARMEMVKCKSAESTSQCVEKWSIEECIEAMEKLGDIDGDTYNKLMDKLVPSSKWRKAFLSMPEHRKKY